MKITSSITIPLAIGIINVLSIYFYPSITGGGSDASIHSFRTAFGGISIICYMLYLGIYFLLSAVIKWQQWPSFLKYVAHVIAITLGYWLLYASIVSISHGGIPSII